MGTRATGEPGDAAAAAPQDQAATIRDEMAAKARQRAALVAPHQAGVADNVCGQDRRQFALLTGQGVPLENGE